MRNVLIRLLVYWTNHVISHVPSHRIRLAWYRRIGVRIGDGSALHLGCFLWFFGPGQVARAGLTIGSHSIVNRDCCLDSRGSLTIGDHVSISPEVMVLTAQHHWRDPGFPLELRPVVIEDHAWIGARATVLPGVRIGRGAVVAAGSVVSSDVAPMTVVGGVPARQLATRPPQGIDYSLDGLRTLFE